MTKQEIIKECLEMINNGAGAIEIFEYIEDNTDFNPAEIIDAIYKKQIFCF